MRPEDEGILVKAFKEQLILDRDLEKAKQDLFDSCSDFNLFDAFKIIDPYSKSYATALDIKDACDDPKRLDLP